MHILLAVLLACSGDDPEPQDTDTTDTDTDTDTDTGVPVTVDSATGDTATTDTDTEPTAVTGTTGTTGDTGSTDTGLGIDLTGRAYRFTPSSLNVVRPSFPLPFTDTIFIMEVIEHDMGANTMDVRVGSWRWAGYGGGAAGQDMCSPTADLTDIDLSTAPTVSFGPVSGSVGFVNLRFPAEEALVDLTFDATFDEVTDSNLEMLLDTGPASSGYGYGANYLCSTLASYGGSCTTCPSTGANTCVAWEANGARARVDAALTVVERTDLDVQGDPACN